MSQDPTVKTIEPFRGPIEPPDEPLEVKVAGTVKVAVTDRRVGRIGTAYIKNAQETVQVLGVDRNRATATILNPTVLPDGSAQNVTVWLVNSRSDSAGNGFPLVPGASQTVEHQGEVYAVAPQLAVGATVTLAFAAELSE